MLRIIDNTLTAFDRALPSKEDLHDFCELLFTIGVDDVELSVAAYERMEQLPDKGRFILNISIPDEMRRYPGFHRYICRQGYEADGLIPEIQINDVREIVKLKTWQNYKELMITGLDDLICGPYEKILNEIKRSLPCSIIIFCPENIFNCASALAVEWLLEFGRDAVTSFAGCKNNAATEEVLMALRLAIRHKPNRDFSVLPQLASLYEKFMNNPIGNKKPIIGKRIFQVEAGIHADGIKKDPATYEAYSPSSVGQKSELIIGKHSGSQAVRIKLEELRLKVPEDEVIEAILQSVKKVCTQGRKSLCDDEFIRLAAEVTGYE